MSRGFEAKALPFLLILYALPAIHPVFIPYLGPPSHLLWWIHVLPVAYLAFTLGGRGVVLGVGVSAVWTLVGEMSFGAGYGISSDLATIVTIPAALVGTELLVVAFALWIRRSDETLRAREHEYRDLFEDAPVPYFVVGQDGRIRRVNRSAEVLLKEDSSALVGRAVESLYPETPEGRSRAREIFRQFLAGAEVQGREIEMERRNGERLWVSLSIRPAHGPDGQIVESRSVTIDVTDRVRAESEVARLAAFPRQSPNPVLELDGGGTVSFANEACWKAIRRMGGSDPRDLLPTGSAAIVAECLETGIGRSDMRVLVGDRTLAWVFQPVRRSGVVHAYAFDVTAPEEELRHLQKMEAIGRFSAGIAHDFNNILTVVLSNCGLVQESGDRLAPEERTCLEDIRASAQRGVGLVDRLLAFSQRRRLEFEAVDVGALVRSFEPTLGFLLSERTRTRIEVEERVPRVRAHPGAIEQMLVNLVANASNAMPEGGLVTIRVESRRGISSFERTDATRLQGEHVVISVQDEGVGIPREMHERVFEPFFTTRGSEQGTGLGLSMVYGLMQQHGGRVELNSELGRGTTFHLVFPAFEAASDAPELRLEETPPTASVRVAGHGETILLVEDEAVLRQTATRILERLGYRVETAEDGEDALEKLIAVGGAVDLVMTDLVMPRMGGLQLFDRARERWPALPFLFISGYSSQEWGGDGEEGGKVRGHVPFLEKPWTIDNLSAVVSSALRYQD